MSEKRSFDERVITLRGRKRKPHNCSTAQGRRFGGIAIEIVDTWSRSTSREELSLTEAGHIPILQ
jgi:hypothetical protein